MLQDAWACTWDRVKRFGDGGWWMVDGRLWMMDCAKAIENDSWWMELGLTLTQGLGMVYGMVWDWVRILGIEDWVRILGIED
jgi:hypothetical protein